MTCNTREENAAEAAAEAEDVAYHAALLDLALGTYGSDEINIDKVDAEDISEGCDGVWVRGWLFLSNETLADAGITNPQGD